MAPESSNAMNPPPEPCSPHERCANQDDARAPATAVDVARPTHRLNGIRCGENSAQLLVSTRDHLYDADDVEAGNGTWQVIGAWSDESAPELTKILSQRNPTGNQSAMQSQTTAQAHFDRAGQRLGTAGGRSGGVSN